MKLVEIWNAQEALNEVKKLKKPPQVSYILMRHMKTVQAELEICEAERVRLLYEVAGKEPGTDVSLEPGSVEYNTFQQGFIEFLQMDSKVTPFPYTLDELVQHVAVAGNSLSEDTLFRMEPLMKAPEAA